MKDNIDVVFIHGWMHDASTWKHAKDYFQNNTLHILELPGFGNTPAEGVDWGVREYAQWTTKQLRDIERPFVLVGHSLGGRIASYMAGTGALTSLCKGVVLYASPSIYRPSFFVLAQSTFASLLKTLGLSRFLPDWLKPADTQDADVRGMGASFRSIVAFDQTTILSRITVPVTLLWGSADESVPLSIAQEMQKLIPRSTLHVIDDVGHNAHLENPALFYATLANITNNY